MENKTFEFIKEFLNSDGISGFEHNIATKFKNSAIKNKATVSRDGFGSVIAKIGEKGPKLMIAAHMDEVGFVVQRIESSGFVRLSPVGGHWPHAILANRVKVINRQGKEFIGVIGSTSVHILPAEQRSKVMEFKDIYVDLGFESAAKVAEAGIEVGDQVINISEATLLADGDKFMAKAIDNRISVAIIAKIIEELNGVSLKSQVYAVATAQEEVGLRGAKASTQQIKPDIAIAIDTTASHDTPNVIPGDTKLGFGVAVTMKDNSAIANPVLANRLFDLAKDKKIPAYKYVSQGGGNDSGETQYSQGGIPVVTIAIPTRYLHTPNEVGSIKDFNAIVSLITEFIKLLDDNELKKYLYQ